MTSRAAVILAAGKGARMKSDLPKVMHKVGARPMIDWSIALAQRAGCERIVVVVHPDQSVLIEHLQAHDDKIGIAYQDPPEGTGHAVRCAQDALAGFRGDLVVLYGDSPLIPPSAIAQLFDALEGGAALGVLGFMADNPGAYGRLIEADDGTLDAIVEAREASPEQLNVRLCNSGVMAGRSERMFRLLADVKNDNAKGEYYLTDLVRLAREEGAICKAVTCSEEDLIGCDSRADLAVAEAAFQARRREDALASGVAMLAPETIWFSYDTLIEPDVILEPNIVFGPGVHVASGSIIRAFSHIEGARIGNNCEIGPFARLRPGAVLARKVKIGNFVEVKKTKMGVGAKANHLAYLGDGEIGAKANIGAGTIFCNYDGFLKYQTRVGEGAFIGSNSALVAPVRVGNGAIIGSGSVITRDVKPDSLSVGRARQTDYEGRAKEFRRRKAVEKADRDAKNRKDS